MRAPRSPAREVMGIVMTLGLVMGATAAVLRLADLLPAYLGGAPRGVERFDTVEALERRVGTRLLLPAYFPDSFRWPPVAIELHREPAPAALLAFAARDGQPGLLLVQALRAGDAPPDGLLPIARVLQTTSVPLADAPATLRRVVDGEGRVWHELAWSVGGRALALRARGPVDQLLRMGGSVRGRA